MSSGHAQRPERGAHVADRVARDAAVLDDRVPLVVAARELLRKLRDARLEVDVRVDAEGRDAAGVELGVHLADDAQERVVRADVDVVRAVVRGARVEVGRVALDVLVLDRARLAELRARAPVHVVADHPRPRLVQRLARLPLALRLAPRGQVHVQVHRDPDREPGEDPPPVLLPPPRRRAVHRHQDVRLAQLDRLPALDERRRRLRLGKVHRERVDRVLLRPLRLGVVVPGGDGADCGRERSGRVTERRAERGRYALTVKRKGHLEKVWAGVWMMGSRSGKKICGIE
jgi:hypothetical protein